MKTVFSTSYRTFGFLAVMLSTIAFSTLVAQAQEDDKNKIEIVDQNGEKVAPGKIKVQGADEALKGRAKKFANGTGGGGNATGGGGGRIIIGGAGGGGIRGGGGMKVEQKDGKIFITDSDGKTREIDVSGARSISVNQGMRTIDKDGERVTKSIGKAIIIGPDGKRTEIDLGGNGGGLPGFAGVATMERKTNKFMIGVNCGPISNVLRAQLQLEDGTGLTVANVSAESPAAAAGIKTHDILMFADDKQLGTQADLVEAVQTAGKENNKLSLTLIRAGKEVGVEVAPVERSEDDLDGLPGVFQGFPGGALQFRQMGPGIIVGRPDAGFAGGGFDEKFQETIQKQMEEMQQRVDEMHQRMNERMQKQMEEMDKR